MCFDGRLLLGLAAVVLADVGCSGPRSSCDGFNPEQQSRDVDPAAMCSAMAKACPGNECAPSGLNASGETLLSNCDVCASAVCVVPNAYVLAYTSVHPAEGWDLEAGFAGDAGADAGGACPTWGGVVTVTCTYVCEGRRTRGTRAARRWTLRTAGDYFAGCAHLEAVSVFAFARLQRELSAHGAPRELIE